jgi:hypothetical protein
MKRHLVLFFSFLSFFSLNLSAKIWINEFMQSNIDELRDDLQDFPDSWVELYNDSDEAVDLRHWYISDRNNYTRGWRITRSTIIQPKSYQLIYCDEVATGVHASFRLESGNNGSIYLFNPNGVLEDYVISSPKQPAPNIARGRIEDAHSDWAYFVKATPNAKNEGITSDILLPSPVFSASGGVYKNELTLSLSLPEGTPENISLSDIYYTLDGSEPTKNNPNAFSYSTKLVIPQVDPVKATPVRAKIISSDYLQNRSATHTYIVVARTFKLPIFSINLDSEYLWDEDFGIHVAGSGKYGIPGNGRNDNVNWNNPWRRPMNVEYFPSQNQNAAINQLGELRIAGGWSRSNEFKSLILYANKRFGTNRFHYQLFDQKPNQDIKSFMLRNSGNDAGSTMIKDATIQLMMGGKVDLDYQAYQPTVIFLNGEYRGILNMRERSNDHYVVANFNGLENIDMIERTATGRELKAGDWAAWNDLMNKLNRDANQIDFKEIERLVDINEFMNYMMIQIYVANTDFPHNNLVMWRPRTEDGKWRYILKDTDFGYDWGRVSHNSINHNYSFDRNDRDRNLFSALLHYEPFKKEFYSRFTVYLGDILSYRGTAHVIDSIRALVEPEMLAHRNRWHGTTTLTNWNARIDEFVNWCLQRNDHIYNQLRSRFSLGSSIPMTAKLEEGTEYTSGDITMNNIPLWYQGFDGVYYEGETVNLKWTGDPKKANAWQVTTTYLDDQITTTYLESEIDFVIPRALNVKFTAFYNNTDTTTVAIVNKPNIFSHISNNQLFIRGLQGKSLVSLYTVSGHLIAEVETFNNEAIIPLRERGVFILKVANQDQIITEKIIN